MTVHLHKEGEKIRIKRGVRQGDTISPKLFTATLESIFRRLNWENKGVKIDGEFLSNLRFADDIFLCTETPQELQQILQELSDESRQMGLKMNITKTKVMVVDNTPINVNNVLIEMSQATPSQPTAAGRRRRISGYERRWAAILPAITRQRAAAVKTDHVICHLKRWNCLQRAFSGPLMSKWSVSGVFLNILKTFRNNHDRKN